MSHNKVVHGNLVHLEVVAEGVGALILRKPHGGPHDLSSPSEAFEASSLKAQYPPESYIFTKRDEAK